MSDPNPLVARIQSESKRADAAEAEVEKLRDRVDELIQRRPEHEFAGDEEGHNCALCDPDSIWKCDADAHFSIPRWEDDKLVKEQGWNLPECCKKCGEKHAGFLSAEAEVARLREALQEIIDMDWDSESRDIADAALGAPPDPKEASE